MLVLLLIVLLLEVKEYVNICITHKFKVEVMLILLVVEKFSQRRHGELHWWLRGGGS